MIKYIIKIKNIYQQNGIYNTILILMLLVKSKLRLIIFRYYTLSNKTNAQRFNWIYINNYWENTESKSGHGSTLHYTENIRKKLPYLFKKYNVKDIFDAPCGDFNWMQHLIIDTSYSYTGGDIVFNLIKELNDKYISDNNIKFISIDLTCDKFPVADIMICRDCLFHLSEKDIFKVLNNFINSNIKYLLTSTHINDNLNFLNKNIKTGDFRLLDLFSSPYNFDIQPLESLDDWVSPDPIRKLCLWSREQILISYNNYK